MDSDMLLTADVAALAVEDEYNVALVRHPSAAYEDTSMMVFNNKRCRTLTPEYIENDAPQTLEWAGPIYELHPTANFLVGYDEPFGESSRLPHVIHYTQGIPEYKECRDCDYADLWFEEKAAMLHSVSWIEIMGQSVHADPVLKRLCS